MDSEIVKCKSYLDICIHLPENYSYLALIRVLNCVLMYVLL